jgi:hypothetical protein
MLDVIITVSGLKITPLATRYQGADTLIRQVYALPSRTKITELLLEVNDWTRFAGTLRISKARKFQKIAFSC